MISVLPMSYCRCVRSGVHPRCSNARNKRTWVNRCHITAVHEILKMDEHALRITETCTDSDNHHGECASDRGYDVRKYHIWTHELRRTLYGYCSSGFPKIMTHTTELQMMARDIMVKMHCGRCGREGHRQRTDPTAAPDTVFYKESIVIDILRYNLFIHCAFIIACLIFLFASR